MESAVHGRLAPSPTGRLHLGHARSLLGAWWSARASGGHVSLRIEDLDESRCRAEYHDGLLEDLRWLGVDWDGEPLVQSRRQTAHREALDRLHQGGWVYPCICTRKDIERAASAPHREDAGSLYPGTCRERFADAPAAWRASGSEPAWRFRSDRIGSVTWLDRLHGTQKVELAPTCGDFVVWTKAGRAAYQLAVVVDDAFQGASEVVRAKDLISSTHQQVALQQALELDTPSFAHLGMVVDPAGHRLAKRTGAHALASLRESGVAAIEIVSWAARSLGCQGADAPAPAWVERWDWQAVSADDVSAPEPWMGER